MLLKNVFPLCLLALVTACDGGSSSPTIDHTPTEQPDPVAPPASSPTNIILSEAVILSTDDIPLLQTGSDFPLQGLWIFTEKRTPKDASGQRLSREIVFIDDEDGELYRCGDDEAVDISIAGTVISIADEPFDYTVSDEKNVLSATYSDDEYSAEFKAIKIANGDDDWSDIVQLTLNSFSGEAMTLSATDVMASCYNYSYLVQTDEDDNKSETAVIILVNNDERSRMSFEFSTQVYTSADGSDDAEQYGLTVDITDADGKTVAHFLNEELTGSPSFDIDNSSFTGPIVGDNNTQTVDLSLSITLNP